MPGLGTSQGPMTREDAQSYLADVGAKADGGFPLLEAALACAVHEDPSRDPGRVRSFAEDAVERLKARLQRESPEEALAETMAGDMRLAGDLITYDSPENTDVINFVVRRKGLPVTLGIFYLDVGRRAGLDVKGVDF